jgi:hypothetical protein
MGIRAGFSFVTFAQEPVARPLVAQADGLRLNVDRRYAVHRNRGGH